MDAEPLELPDVLCDLGRSEWPWPDNSVDEAVASHILEHLPGESFFHFMRELYRVCKHNATVKVALPWPRHDIYINDPTHYRPITPGTLILFSPRYIDELAKKGQYLTNFGARTGTNFELAKEIQYCFDQSIDVQGSDPVTLDYRVRHEWNIIQEWHGVLRVVKERL